MRIHFALAVGLIACTSGAGPTDGIDETDAGLEPVVVRVVSWNIQGLGPRTSAEGEAERAVLARIDADVVALNEVAGEQTGRLRELAEDLGYETVYLPGNNPFGSLRNAVLTRLPAEITAPTAAELSGDSRANDCTRWPVRAVLDVPDAGEDLTLVVNHWKSGFDLTDRFRRTLDGVRTAQAAEQASGPVMVVGDVNAELEDMPESPPSWSYAPSDLPGDYQVGSDQRDRFEEGVPNNAFAGLTELGLAPLEARQVDGRADTRPASGRRIDWVFMSPELLEDALGEVYDSTDEGQGSGLPKAGEAPGRHVSSEASDHLPIFVDVALER